MRLTRAIRAWGTPGFRNELKAEIERIGIGELPLQRALTSGNYVLDEKPTVLINGVDEHDDVIIARVGLFFAGINAGSCCAGDPTPVEPHLEYCVIQFDIDRATGETQVTLLGTGE